MGGKGRKEGDVGGPMNTARPEPGADVPDHR